MKRGSVALLLAGIAVGAACVGTVVICATVRKQKKKKAAMNAGSN